MLNALVKPFLLLLQLFFNICVLALLGDCVFVLQLFNFLLKHINGLLVLGLLLYFFFRNHGLGWAGHHLWDLKLVNLVQLLTI